MSRWLVVAVLALFVFLALVVIDEALSRPPIPPSVFVAVRAHWQTRPERVKAFDVVACETGGAYNTTAHNGQYLGLFQMGARERSRYGHGETALAQARAAFRYYAVAGWRPWRGCA